MTGDTFLLVSSSFIAEEIVSALGEAKSVRFSQRVAAKVPVGVIRETLAEMKADGAREPARLFTYRMQRSAFEQRKGEWSRALADKPLILQGLLC
jgi:hypothetical protein